jgi:uncharacterized protein (DUF433 family)
MKALNPFISVHQNTLGGAPVFRGTRVPVQSLFEYLENDYSLDEFLDCFPSVTRENTKDFKSSSREKNFQNEIIPW